MCAPLATVGAAVPPPCGLASKIQTLELYPEEWLMANSPTCAGFDPAKQAEYQSALQAASQVAGATHGR
jgi:hypothetical protein